MACIGDMKLRYLHPDSSISKASLAYWRKQSTDRIVDSLRPGNRHALKVKVDGTIMDGNTRVKVLEERRYALDSLPIEPYP